MAKTKPTIKTQRPTRKESRRERDVQRHAKNSDTTMPEEEGRPVIRKIQCRSDKQKLMLNLLNDKRLVIAEGPAGVGKTFISTLWACEQFDARRFTRMVFTRPAVEAADEHLGYLPGEIGEKFAPWFEPFRRILAERYGQSALENMMKRGKVEVMPLAYMRGLTYDNTVILLDEAQNSTPKQMKLLLTRMGVNTVAVVDGDVTQKDIRELSGLEDIAELFNDMDSVGRVVFDKRDVVRDGIVREFLERYDNRDANRNVGKVVSIVQNAS